MASLQQEKLAFLFWITIIFYFIFFSATKLRDSDLLVAGWRALSYKKSVSDRTCYVHFRWETTTFTLGEKPLSALPQDADVFYELVLVVSAWKIKLNILPPQKPQTHPDTQKHTS